MPALVFSIIRGPADAVAFFGAVVAALAGLPLAKLLDGARRMLRAGFTADDLVAAFAQDVKLKEEEFRFQVGKRTTLVDTVVRWLKRLGYAGAAVSLPLVWTMPSPEVWSAFSWSFLTGLSSSVLLEIRARTRSDVHGERWLKLWKGWVGKGLLRLSGIGVKRVAPAVSGVHRATEVALGLAADRLFEELPKETRKALKGLPETVRALEDDARTMRRQVEELDAVLAEIGDDDPARAGAEERSRVRAGVATTRDEAKGKLQQAVKALETIRLGLLLMHGGSGTVESLTMDLASAQEISEQMANILEGHREVERLLQERRRTGVITLGETAGEWA